MRVTQIGTLMAQPKTIAAPTKGGQGRLIYAGSSLIFAPILALIGQLCATPTGYNQVFFLHFFLGKRGTGSDTHFWEPINISFFSCKVESGLDLCLSHPRTKCVSVSLLIFLSISWGNISSLLSTCYKCVQEIWFVCLSSSLFCTFLLYCCSACYSFYNFFFSLSLS